MAAASLVIAALGASAGCAAAGTDSDSNVEITYWLWDTAQLPGYQQCADDFHEQNPDVTVNIEQYAWDDYWTQLQTAMATESAPDVFTDHVTYYPQFASSGQLLDISDRVEAAGIDLTQYQEGLADLWVGEDGTSRYGLPKDWDTVALFYNTEMIEDAGYTAEDLQNLTWNPDDGGTFEKLIAHLTVDANGVRGDEAGFDPTNVAVYGLGNDNAGSGFGSTQWAHFALSDGWYYVNDNPWGDEFYYSDSAFEDTMAWWTGLIDKGYMPSLAVSDSGVSMYEAYAAGKYALLPDGDWEAKTYASADGITTGFAPLPSGPDGESVSVINGLSDGIWAGTEHPDEAFDWVAYMASTACQDVMAEQAVIFPAISSSTEKAVQAFSDSGMDVSAFTSYVDSGNTYLLPIADHWADVVAIINPTIESIMNGDADVSSLDDANDQVNALFQ
ncbi:MAG: sugar ABC transporter substrate-binding protein [Microbacterium sp.]|uniref:ABC transporter substrate-binding protein n=1 Tax=Microbacterium sp. TaxID=51671 RepID=UPI0039E56EA4